MRELGKGKGALLVFVVIAISALWMTWAYAAPSITSVTTSPESLKATGSSNSTIRYTLSETSRTKISILDSSGTAVKTLLDATVTAGTRSKTWNGKNTAGTLVDEATYTVSIEATGTTGSTSDTSGSIFIDKTAPTISGLSVSTSTIESSATTCDITYTLSEVCTAVTIRVYRGSSLVKYLANRATADSGTNTISWDLTDSRDHLVSDDVYTIKFDARDASGRQATQVNTTVVVDCSDPVIASTSLSKSVFSPTGRNSVSVRYTLSETARVSIVAYDSSDTVAGTLLSETTKTAYSTSRAKSYSVNWKARVGTETTPTVDDGTYTIMFTATDTAGNVDTDTATIVIDKTAPTCTIGSLSSLTTGAGQYVHIPLTFSEDTYYVTVYILDSNGRTRKTLCNKIPIASDGATLIWDGKRNSTSYWDAGTYTVRVWTKDESGNTDSTTSNFTIN
jgi:flagellar hook assembly protein FlgD